MNSRLGQEREILERPPPPADRRLWYGPLDVQFGDLRLAAAPTAARQPLAIVIHGGFWRARYDLLHIGHLAAALTARGVATWSLEYRRVGNGGGWPATLEDVAAGAEHAEERQEELELPLALQPADADDLALVHVEVDTIERDKAAEAARDPGAAEQRLPGRHGAARSRQAGT